ncbi:MAG: hypothetical protein LUQ32_08265 [Methanomicrobiales archaeon]|nr:hypothetical protein [Methanomicrobiales archaeon]
MDAEGVFFISLGSTIMGFVVGWLGLYFIAREISFTAAEFGGFITAFFGGAVLQVYTTQLAADTRILFWFYPIGLLAALLFYNLGDGKFLVKITIAGTNPPGG